MSLVNLHGLTDEQKMMRESVLAICEKHLPWDRIRRMEEERAFPHDAYNALAEAGYLGLFYPEALGGSDGSRDSRVGPIGGGSNEIQRNVLTKRMGL